MNQTHDRANDADGGRVATHALVDLGRHQVSVFTVDQLHFKNAAQRLRLTAVDQQLQALASKGVGLQIGQRFQPKQTFLAGNGAPVDNLGDTFSQTIGRRKDNPAQDHQSAFEHGQRRLNKSRAQGTADDNQRRRAIQQGTGMPTFQIIAADNGDKSQNDANDAEDIHQPISAK